MLKQGKEKDNQEKASAFSLIKDGVESMARSAPRSDRDIPG